MASAITPRSLILEASQQIKQRDEKKLLKKNPYKTNKKIRTKITIPMSTPVEKNFNETKTTKIQYSENYNSIPNV